eukprot:2901192-Rhodomonas_salina.4
MSLSRKEFVLPGSIGARASCSEADRNAYASGTTAEAWLSRDISSNLHSQPRFWVQTTTVTQAAARYWQGEVIVSNNDKIPSMPHPAPKPNASFTEATASDTGSESREQKWPYGWRNYCQQTLLSLQSAMKNGNCPPDPFGFWGQCQRQIELGLGPSLIVQGIPRPQSTTQAVARP